MSIIPKERIAEKRAEKLDPDQAKAQYEHDYIFDRETKLYHQRQTDNFARLGVALRSLLETLNKYKEEK